jgi:hypothetical protein
MVTTRLPQTVLDFLDSYAQTFGGSQGVLQFLTDYDIEYLVTFPGPTYIAKPWAAALDMGDYGYQVGLPYSVFDNQMRHVYTSISSDGYFGNTDLDAEMLIDADHGSFAHLQFEAPSGPVLILLWVCNQLSEAQRHRQIAIWQNNADRYLSQQLQHEIYLSTDLLQPTDTIAIYFVPGIWSQQYTPTDMRQHPNRIVSAHGADEQIIYLNLQQSGWYLFDNVRGQTITPMNIGDFRGVGVQRLRLAQTGVYFISLSNRDLTAARPTVLGLPSRNELVGGHNAIIRLEGSLINPSDPPPPPPTPFHTDYFTLGIFGYPRRN